MQEEINELHTLALRIVRHQRNEDHLQPLETIRAKFSHEVGEFNAEVGIAELAELADIVYYAVQEYFQLEVEKDKYKDDYEVRGNTLQETLEIFSELSNISPEQALQIALIKYRFRAEKPGNKDHERENAAIAQYMKR